MTAEREMLERMASRGAGEQGQAWSNPSVRAFAEGKDPVEAVLDLAEEAVLEAREQGWEGPPFDPFALAELRGVKVVPVDELAEARLVHVGRSPRIEYNPNRPGPRVRFSVAHELGHLLFPDASEEIRYRAHGRGRRADDWQLELLCNLAAAEFLMPVGSFPPKEAERLDVNHLMALRTKYQVSSEALLLRVARLTSRPAAVFAAARLAPDEPRYRLDYVVGTRAWPAPISPGVEVTGPPLADCTAIGHTAKDEVEWNGHPMRIECVGIPPYPGNRYPRVLGVMRPQESVPSSQGIKFVHGDATDPRGAAPWVIAHVVNDRAKRWGGFGFAGALKEAYPQAHDEYVDWQGGRRHLGQVHVTEPEEGLTVCSLVAQHGYGPDRRDRVSYVHLRTCLRELAQIADEREAGVHMPLIGTGQAGGDWATIRDLVLEQLAAAGLEVTAYVLSGAAVPDEGSTQLALSA